MTDYERELNPIFDEEMERELSERRRFQPLHWILDRLQTGNYISANVADEIAKALVHRKDPERGDPLERGDLLRAIVEGVTGERKTTYEQVLRDTLQVGQTKLFKGASEGSRWAQMDWADVLGFVGDVLLDPLTYMTFGGASKGAQIAASKFADDAVRLMGKQLIRNPKQLARLSRVRGAGEMLERALASDVPERAMRSLAKNSDDLGRLLTRTYNEAFKKAMNRTQAQLPELASKLTNSPIEELAGRFSGDVFGKAGERFKFRFLGKEYGIGEATKLGDLRRRSWESFKNLVKQAPGATNFRNAIWGAMNRGPIGELRKMLGVRNPYQKYLRNLERENTEFAMTEAAQRNLSEAYRTLDGLSDEQVAKVRDFMADSETMERAALAAQEASTREMMSAPMGTMKMRVVEGADPEVARAAEELNSVLDAWRRRSNEIAADLGEGEISHYEWYVPEVFRFRSGGPNMRRGRQYTFSEQRVKESKVLQFVFGIDEDMANRIVESNLSGLSVDLKEMLAAKALHQAKIESRHRLVQTFREFGLDLDDIPDQALAESLRMGGRDFTQIGVRAIDHPAFKTADGQVRYLFDYDTADIIERALDVSGPKRGQIGKIFHSYMNWWKGMVLLTSGYTLRNFQSNTMTQFLRHGARAFNPKEIQQSIAAVVYVMRKTNPKNLGKMLDSLGKSEGWLDTMLNTRIGDLTVRELADEAYRRGVISENLMAFEGKSIAEKAAGKAGQPVRTAARAVNTFTENVPRFQSFLIDVADEGTNPEVMDWAARQARQWFIDYGDLSQFEQRVMKNVIPFYTFLRKNISNQLNGIALYPELYGMLGKIERLAEYEGVDQELIPEWMQQEGMFAIGEMDEGLFKMFRPDFAYTDLNMLPFVWEEDRFLPYFDFEELKHDLINASAPWIRDLAARMTTENGYNYFYRNELGEEGDAPYLMRLFLSHPGTMAAADGLMRFFGFEDGAGLRLNDEGKLQMDARRAQALETYIPVLRQFEMLMYLPQAVIPGLERAIEAATNAEDDYEGAEQGLQLLSYFLGIKMKPHDIQRERERLEWETYYTARDLLNETRRQLPGYERRSREARDRTRASIRRLRG